MPDTQLPISVYIKQGILIAVMITVTLFGLKTYRKYQHQKSIITELVSYTNEAAAYEQLYLENAQQNLLKAMYHMHKAVEMGNIPEDLINDVLNADTKELLSAEAPDKLSTRKTLIRDSILSNYEKCIQLGIFDDSLNLDLLSDGDFPIIYKGPEEGEKIQIQTIIPAAALPGCDKLLPNMVIGAPEGSESEKNKMPSDFEITRGKKLAKQLESANIIENSAYKEVIEYYQLLHDAFGGGQ